MRHSSRGFTLVEMTIAIAILAIIGTVVASYIKQSQILTSKASYAQENITQEIATLQVVLQDLRNANRTSIGSFLLNGDFESKLTSSQPMHWSAAAGGTGLFQYITSSSSDTSHHGYHSVSLQSTDGTVVRYDSLMPIKLSSGTAYMLTAKARTTNAASLYGISLVDTLGVALSPAIAQYGNSTSWSNIQIRFPLTGTYSLGSVTNDRVVVRLLVKDGVDLVYLDDVSFAPLQAVLISTNTDEVNINSTETSLSDPVENTGFKFVRYEDGSQKLFRYRIDRDKFGESVLAREYFDTGANSWLSDSPNQLMRGIRFLKIIYDANNQLPTNGKDTALSLVYGFANVKAEKEKAWITPYTINIYPLVP